jgi:hypothetical protein
MSVQRCKSACGLCKGAKVKATFSGGRWRPQVAGGGKMLSSKGRPETGELVGACGSRALGLEDDRAGHPYLETETALNGGGKGRPETG